MALVLVGDEAAGRIRLRKEANLSPKLNIFLSVVVVVFKSSAEAVMGLETRSCNINVSNSLE